MSSNEMPRIKLSEKLGFCSFSTASNVVYQFKSLYYLFFLTNVLKIPVLSAGMILTVGTVWDAVNDPLVGFWALNRFFGKRREKCRPLALYFAFPWAITVALLFTDFGLKDDPAIIVALVIYIFFELFNTMCGIPYNSMAGLATNLDADRRSINVWRNMGSCFGSAIGAVACLPLLKLFGALDKKGNLIDGKSSSGFLYTAMVMGAVCIIGCLSHYFTTMERVKPVSAENAAEKLSVKRVAKMLFASKNWILNMFYIICYGAINLLLMSTITYYATYVMGSTASATMIQAAYLAAAVLSSLVVGKIDAALGRKKTMMLSAIVAVSGKIWFILSPHSAGAIYVNAISAGFAITVAFVMFNTNRNNIVDLIEWKDGHRLDSMVSTADNLAAKLASAGATLLISKALHSGGFNAELSSQPGSAVSAICSMLGWVPAVVALVMLAVVFFMDIDKEMAEMEAEKKASV